jgi:hypothetical protein
MATSQAGQVKHGTRRTSLEQSRQTASDRLMLTIIEQPPSIVGA